MNPGENNIDDWIDMQLNWVEYLSVTEEKYFKQYLDRALLWYSSLLKTGFTFPLFIIMDLGIMIVQKSGWKQPFKEFSESIHEKQWHKLQEKYSHGLRQLHIMLQNNNYFYFPFQNQKKVKEEDNVIVHEILNLIFLLGWQQLTIKFPEQWQIDFNKLMEKFLKRKEDQEKSNEDFFTNEQLERFKVILDWDGKVLEPSKLANFYITNWEATIAFCWNNSEYRGNNYLQFLDYQMVSKYLANYAFPPTLEILKRLEKPSQDQSIIIAESKRYTSYDRITRHATVIAPAELSYLAEADAEDYFWSKFAENSLSTLGTESPENEPNELSINFVIPEVAEMGLFVIIDDEQSFLSYAKYLTLLFWHDFIFLYVASGCSEENLFTYNLRINELNVSGKWQEKCYSPVIHKELINFHVGYMLQLRWLNPNEFKEASNYNQSYNDIGIFYHPDLEFYAMMEKQLTISSKDQPEYHLPREYWLLFIPEKYLFDIVGINLYTEQMVGIPDDRHLSQLIRKNNRRYQHILVISLNNIDLYEVIYGTTITLKILTSKDKNRTENEHTIRKLLLYYYVNEAILPNLITI